MRSVGEILAKARKEKGYSQTELVELLSHEGIHITAKALSKWERGNNEPGLKSFFALCRLLEIQDIYGTFLEENPFETIVPFTSRAGSEETETHSILNGLNQDGKDKIAEYAQILKASKMFEPVCENVIPLERYLDIYLDSVSAGTGNFLLDSPKESYPVHDLAPDCADYGVRITGDSMEPAYYDGEIAWVQQMDSILNGETGIFCLNGCSYIKKLHDEPEGCFLVSLNKKYEPIPILETDSLKIFGKVVGKSAASDIPGFYKTK